MDDITELIRRKIYDYKFLALDKLYKVPDTTDYRSRFLYLQGWFLRCSSNNKVCFIKQLAKNTKNVNNVIFLLNTLYSATCKDRVYSVYQGTNSYISDIMQNDDNRSLRASDLKRVVHNEIDWFRSLTIPNQFCVMADLVRLGDSSLHGKIFKNLLCVIKERNMEILNPNYFISNGEVVGEDSMISEIEKMYSFLNLYIPESDPKDKNNIKLKNLLISWFTFIDNFKIKLGIDEFTKLQAEKKKDKRNKNEKLCKTCTDYIQMLPIWINKPIIATLDLTPKEKKKLKLNKFWKFLIKGVNQDIQCRKNLDRILANLKGSEIDIDLWKTSKTPNTFVPSSNCAETSRILRRNLNKNCAHTYMNDQSLISEILPNVKGFSRCVNKNSNISSCIL